MKNKEGINYVLVNFAFFIFIFYILSKLNLISDIINILSIIFFSLLFSYILYPVYKLISKKMNNVLSLFIIYIFLFLIIIFLIYLIIPKLSILNDIISLFNNIILFIDKINIRYNLNINIDVYLTKIINYILNNGIDIIKNIISVLSKFIFVLIFSACILLNIEYIKSIINKYKHRVLIYNIHNKLRNYLVANLKIISIQFIEYTVIYYLIGHPNYLFLGILNSINSFIPYVGTFLTNVIAITTASVINNRLLFFTSIFSVLLPNIDSYVINPKIYKNTNQLPQTLCITFMILFGILFKVLGIIFSIPVLIVVIEVLKYKNLVKSK